MKKNPKKMEETEHYKCFLWTNLKGKYIRFSMRNIFLIGFGCFSIVCFFSLVIFVVFRVAGRLQCEDREIINRVSLSMCILALIVLEKRGKYVSEH